LPSQVPRDAEAAIGIVHICRHCSAEGRAQKYRRRIEGSAVARSLPAIAIGSRGSVGRYSGVIRGPAVVQPLPQAVEISHRGEDAGNTNETAGGRAFI
jgi:hypothetical protein